MIAYYIGAAGFTALFLTAFATDHRTCARRA